MAATSWTNSILYIRAHCAFKKLLTLLVHADPMRALEGNGIVFVRDPDNIRVDIAVADTAFDESAIQRAQNVEVAPGVIVTFCSAEDLIVYKMLSVRPQDYEDVVNVVRKQGDKLDDRYVLHVLHWLRQFELALDDSTLVATYKKLRKLK